MSLDTIFAQAIEIASAQERAAFLEQACANDPGLRREVEQLVSDHFRAGAFLELPAAQLLATDAGPVSERPGTVIGPYKLMEQIGEGGMGLIFVAEQQQPVRRKVALKVIKPGMDSRQVIARFEAERQALALMDHPNIAKVLDGGTTASGRPYFVMELVKGVPITQYCDDNRLPTRQRLGLFVSVCQAVQHAHTKGIIHRDLKPSNVLVTSHDGTPVVKVIDFGVAKAIGQPLTDKTVYTQFTQLLGTPLYMSPEQAGLSGLDIDTRTDIYALGVLLYELLTGTTPFDQERLGTAAFDEIRRIIREEEPARPSARISTLGLAAATLSANRRSDPKGLSRLFRGELDWVVMKALEKDRSRRYETASAFAADVQRYLHDEPVQACPPSAGYRLRKFVRRHKGPVLAASVVVLALVGGMLGTTVGLVQAEQARRTAAEQRRVAEEERAVARAVNDFLQQDLLRQADSREQLDRGFAADPNLTVKEALHRAAARLGDRFQDQPLVEAAIRQAIGEAYLGVGEYQRGAFQLERALELRKAELGPDHLLTLSSMNSLAGAYLHEDRPVEALVLSEQTVKGRRAKLGPAHPDTVESLTRLATAYRSSGRRQDALALQEETLQLAKANLGPDHVLTLRCMITLSMHYRFAGRLPEAIALQEESLELSKAKRGACYPGTLVFRSLLGMSYELAGRRAEAVSLHEETLRLMKAELGVDHPYTLATMWALAKAYRGADRLVEAVALQEESVKLSQARRGLQDPTTERARSDLAALHLDLRRYDLAEPLLRQCLPILEKQWPGAWTTFEAKSRLGGALLGQQKYADAEPLLVQGYEGLKQRRARSCPEDQGSLTTALERLVQLYDAWDKPDEAAKWRKELEAVQNPAKKPTSP